MKHQDYCDYIDGRNDLDPDQKKILKRDHHNKQSRDNDNAKPQKKPTAEKFEPSEEYTYRGVKYIVGLGNGRYWVVKERSNSDKMVFVSGPEESREKAVKAAKEIMSPESDAMREEAERALYNLGNSKEEVVLEAETDNGTLYRIINCRTDSEGGPESGFKGVYFPKQAATNSTDIYSTLEKAKSETLYEISKCEKS